VTSLFSFIHIDIPIFSADEKNTKIISDLYWRLLSRSPEDRVISRRDSIQSDLTWGDLEAEGVIFLSGMKGIVLCDFSIRTDSSKNQFKLTAQKK